MTSFAERLKHLRELKKESNKKWTQKYAADKIGVARETYTGYERGTKTPPIFEVSTDYLLGRDTEETKFEYYKNKIVTEFPNIDLMFHDMESLTAEDLQDVYEFIKFKKSQKK